MKTHVIEDMKIPPSIHFRTPKKSVKLPFRQRSVKKINVTLSPKKESPKKDPKEVKEEKELKTPKRKASFPLKKEAKEVKEMKELKKKVSFPPVVTDEFTSPKR